MEAPPSATAQPTTPIFTTNPPLGLYPDSAASSPRSRKNDSWEADTPPQPKLRLMCSYGGNIVPRPHDKTLCYAGGDTRIIVIERNTSLSEMHRRLSRTLLNNQPFSLKYQLPTEDLDSLITVTSDEDLENMVEEYDRLHNAAASSVKPGRIRLFLFPNSPPSIDQLLLQSSSSKPEDWFLNALNGKSSNQSTPASDRGFSESSSINNLLGLDEEFGGKTAAAEKDAELKMEGSKTGGGTAHGNPISDSPMVDTTSSFGSASSSPSVANLPPIRMHVEELRKVGGLGIQEQFQQMSVVGAVRDVKTPTQKKEEEGASAAGAVASPLPVVVGGEYRLVSDDERSDHGGQRKHQKFQQAQTPPQQISPDSVSSDGSVANQVYGQQRQAIYHQEHFAQMQSATARTIPNQLDSNSVDQTNPITQMQPQLHQLQPQQFIHAGGNPYIPSNAVPMPSYYPTYPPQPQQQPHQSMIDQHYPVYFVSGQQPQAYNTPLQQPNYRELAQTAPSTHPQAVPPAAVASLAAYSQTTTPATQSLQVPSSQAQFLGYVPIHPSSLANYSYELFDPAPGTIYYAPITPQMASQYLQSTPASAPPPAEPV